MMTGNLIATTASVVVASSALAMPAVAGAQEDGPDGAAPAQLAVEVNALRSGQRPAFRTTIAAGTLTPFVAGQWVRVQVVRNGMVLAGQRVRVRNAAGGEHGTFTLRSPHLIEPGRYRIRVTKPATAEQAGAQAVSQSFVLRYPSLTQGDQGRAVQVLQRRLRELGFRAPSGRRFTAATARAVLAFRKVNRMAWTRRASPEVLTPLLRGRGAFKPRHPRAGRHVEVDLARQVMVLAKGRTPRYTFHISSGAPSTPSDRGHFRFYRRVRGYNRLGMLDPVYYNRGEALHGYRSVPAYPASHGCIRSATADARIIFNWVKLGMSIYVY
jgi:hypothetical protein